MDNDRAAFLREYSSNDAIARYVARTAGKGIQYNLNHVYGQLYSEIIDDILADRVEGRTFRVLEYGCDGGMNLIWILQMLMRRKLPLIEAIGSDFSQPIVAAAQKEKERLPSPYDEAGVGHQGISPTPSPG